MRCRINELLTHQFDTEEVAGSNPVVPTIKIFYHNTLGSRILLFLSSFARFQSLVSTLDKVFHSATMGDAIRKASNRSLCI